MKVTSANAAWQGVSYEDTPTVLNLALSLDERQFLDVDLRALLTTELAKSTPEMLDRYDLADPYAQDALGDAVAGCFGMASCSVTAASGVTALLAAVADLAADGGLFCWGLSYPDVAYWAIRRGHAPARDFRAVDLDGIPDGALVLLDRPSCTCASPDVEEVLKVARALARRGGALVVDESYGNYLAPVESLAAATQFTPGLVVLRGFSKGFWLGSLRVGFAVTSEDVTTRLRSVVPPMMVPAASSRLARKVLQIGDVTSELRRRVQEVDQTLRPLLSARGLEIVSSNHPIPYLIVQTTEVDAGPDSLLAARNVRAKWQPFWSGAQRTTVRRYRVSLPLAPSRVRRAVDALR